MCTEFISIDGGLRRPVSVSWVIINGTAECEACTLYAFITGTFSYSSNTDGIDFATSSIAAPDMSDSVFLLDSSPGDTLCITISLLNDTLFESNEDFVVELNTGDPSLTILEHANLAVVTITDIPHSLCKNSEDL